MNKTKVVWLDAIKVIAMVAVMTFHFNIRISGVFVSPYEIIPNYIGVISLGSLGVSLFFIASGCGFEISYEKESPFSVKKYYWKRFKSIYPMYWIAWICTFCFNLLVRKKLPDAPLESFILTILGMDGYFVMLFDTPANFYLIGEWFLGCIILLYLMMPIINHVFQKKPFLVFLISLLVSFGCEAPFLPSFLAREVCILRRIPEVIFGMILIKFFPKLNMKHSLISLALGICIYLAKSFLPVLNYKLLLCMCLFLLLSGILVSLRQDIIKSLIHNIGSYFYPELLVHHYLIAVLAAIVKRFLNPEFWTKREIIILYIVYVGLLCILCMGLKRLHQKVIKCFRTVVQSLKNGV